MVNYEQLSKDPPEHHNDANIYMFSVPIAEKEWALEVAQYMINENLVYVAKGQIDDPYIMRLYSSLDTDQEKAGKTLKELGVKEFSVKSFSTTDLSWLDDE